MPRFRCSNRGNPTSASSSFSCCDTAGWVKWSSRAARVKDFCCATAVNTRISLRLIFRNVLPSIRESYSTSNNIQLDLILETRHARPRSAAIVGDVDEDRYTSHQLKGRPLQSRSSEVRR